MVVGKEIEQLVLRGKCQAHLKSAEYTAPPGVNYNPHLEKACGYDILIPVSLLSQPPELRNLSLTHQDPLTARLGLILRETAQLKFMGRKTLDEGSICIGLSFFSRAKKPYLYTLFLTDKFTQVSLDKLIREESGADSPSLLRAREGTIQDLQFFNQLLDLIPRPGRMI